MKPGVFIGLLMGLTLISAEWCRAATWPASCGGKAVKFDVKALKSRQAPPAVPAPGKAEIVFLENENQMIGPFMYATVRFGVDGAWVGADKGNSYFSVDVAPGAHDLCANWQSDFPQQNKNIDLTSFTAAPGKVYYFSADIKSVSRYEVDFRIRRLHADLARYRISSAKLAESRVK